MAGEEVVNDSVKVLFVDDEENILRAIERLFMDEDFEVITATSGEEGLEILRESKDIGLIVTDQRMPGLSGVDFLEKAKKIAPFALRIILTGYADVNAATDAINRGGAFRYITKPWNDEDFVQTIKEAVQRCVLIRENKRLIEVVRKQNNELRRFSARLKRRVEEKTAELKKKNEKLEELNEKLERMFKSTIVAFSGLVDLCCQGMGDHSRNVSSISTRVAKDMGLCEEDVQLITVASLLHDIGKIGISNALLQKDFEEMDPGEQEEYKTHPVRGQMIIDSVEGMRNAGILIRHHHEFYNGMGFPDGLRAYEIPIGSRIIAMADFVDRKMSKCKGNNAVEKVLMELEKELHKKFDSKLYSYVRKATKEIYTFVLPFGDMIEQELRPENLKEGMVVSRDVKSGTGVLLLRGGKKLNRHYIQSLVRCYEIDPPREGIFVWMDIKKDFSLTFQVNNVVERELCPEGLKEGMVVSRDVRSGTGVLVLRKGAKLNHKDIEKIMRYYKLDPPKKGIFVWFNRQMDY